MEVYILDSFHRRTDVVDVFESLIWTERVSAYGEFELKVQSTVQNRMRFRIDAHLAMNESNYMMRVETVEDTTDKEGRNILIVRGTSLERIMEDRVAKNTLSDLTVDPKWTLTGTPTAIARQMFHEICVTGDLSSRDVIGSLVEDTFLPESTLPEPSDSITYEVEPNTLYTAMKELADMYEFGFRILRNQDTTQFYFDVYMGSDRTAQQTTLPAVVFTQELDNLENTTELTTISAYKNVAYVFSPVGTVVVYPEDVDPVTVKDMERRVLLVMATDITDTNPTTAAEKLNRRGREELAKHRQFSGFDGEISQNSKYKYNKDYYLNDLVDVRNKDGLTNIMRVTEQIFVSDRDGERSYPTLTIYKFVTPGSWASWDSNEEWADVGATEYWEDQP